MTRKKKYSQETFGEKPFISKNKKIIKKSTLRFYPAHAQTPEAILQDTDEEYHRTKFYALCSGGKDSQCMTNWLDSTNKLKAVLHIKTNIGLQMTADFISDYCQSRGFKLYIEEPKPKFVIVSHVLQYGWPSYGHHAMIMGKLKYKTMRDFALTIDRKNHCLMSGVRKFESTRRMGNYPEPIVSDSQLWFACPYFYKTDEEIYKEYITSGLPISPAYKLGFNTSGECLCGAYAALHEKQLIHDNEKKLSDFIAWMEDGIDRFGTIEAKRHARWGEQAKMSDLDSQKMVTEFIKDNPDLSDVEALQLVTCGEGCGAGSMRAMENY